VIVSSSRPSFAPFPGLFQKAMLSDVLVLLDSVQFPRGTTWLNRNRFKNDQGTYWMTVPVWRKGLGLQNINEVRICREGPWALKHLSGLQAAYGKAPFFEDCEPFFSALFSRIPELLVDLNLHIFRYIMDLLKIETRVLLLSELGLREKEPELSVALCRRLGGVSFLTQTSAAKYLPEKKFEEASIERRVFRVRPIVYPQLWGPFIMNLSVLDLIFTCGPVTARRILAKPLARS